jgi:putative transposase
MCLVGGDPVLRLSWRGAPDPLHDHAIEALNAKLRRAVQTRGHFPTDDAAMKLLFLVLHRAEKAWIMPPRKWTMAKAQFVILFGERFTRAQA